jgi:ribose 5-phosphate isomerase B
MSSESAQFQTIYLAADHAGFLHKESVRNWLLGEGFAIVDVGAYVLNTEDDFPGFMQTAALGVARNQDSSGAILFGGSGQGEAMAANRIKGVRAAVYYGAEETIINLSREHNNANVLSIGARFVSVEDSKKVIWDWLHTKPFSDDKYTRRNEALDRFAQP